MASAFKLPEARVAGRYTFISNKRGKLAEFDNLITNAGLDAIGTGIFDLNYCFVGSGSTPPSETESTVPTWIAASNTNQAQVDGRLATSPYYIWRRKTFRFALGVAAGNISEVSIALYSNGTTMVSRALVKDAEGNPTTITILADEILDVVYEFRVYPPLGDSTGTVVLSGNIGGTHSWVMRACRIQTDTSQYNPGWQAIPSANDNYSYNTRAYTGSIGDIFNIPSGTASAELTVTRVGSYVAGSFKRAYKIEASASQANQSIKSLRVSAFAPFQMEFTPAIVKSSSDLFSINIEVSWARYAP